MNEALNLFIRFYVSTWSRHEIAFFFFLSTVAFMKIFLDAFLLFCAFFFFYCLWCCFMELGDLWSNQPEETSIIDIEHIVTSKPMPIFPPSPIKKKKKRHPIIFVCCWHQRQFLWHSLHHYLNMMVNISALKSKEKPPKITICRILEESQAVDLDTRNRVSVQPSWPRVVSTHTKVVLCIQQVL